MFLPSKAIEPSHIFMLFYSFGVVADVNDIVERSSFGWLILAAGIWVACSLTRLSFLTLLLVSTFYLVLEEVPDAWNHYNLLVFTNSAIMLCLVYSYTRERGGNEAIFYEITQPVARLSIIVVLAVAGFHKFNTDFINPHVSCVYDFTAQTASVAVVDFLGIGVPPIVFLVLIFLIVTLMLWRQRPRGYWPPIDWVGIATPIVAILAGIALLAFVVDDLQVSEPRYLLVLVLAVVVLSWQILEAPLLLAPRFQWVALCFCMIVHAHLAFLRIVDFQTIAVALLITFVPAHVWQAWNRMAFASVGPVKVHRARLYFLLNMLGLLIMFAQAYGIINWPRPLTAWGLLFITGLLVMLWPIISDLFSPSRTWRWQGVPVFNGVTPKWLYVIPLCLLLFGFTSHFGLRTAGNLSMYSNLRTEAGRNNHLILGGNQLKWASYQEDVVRILDMGDDVSLPRNLLNYGGKLEGNMLPLVEFRKVLFRWRERGEVVPMTVEYQGVVTEYVDIAQSPAWKVNSWDWEMRLLDFRVIQSDEGANTCRW